MFVSVLFTDIKMDASANKVTNIQLENIEALACYPVYGGGFLVPTECCPPWYWWCFSFEGFTFNGWATYPEPV